MRKLLFAFVVWICGVTTSSADIIGVTGDFQVFSPATAAYVADPYNDPTPAPIHIWVEQDNITLAAAVQLDTDLANPALQYVIAAPGPGQVVFGPASGPLLPAGARIDVHYVYFDPFLDGARGTVTFDAPVLGIVAHTIRLQFSDFLRVPGAPYPGNPAFVARGWDDTEWAQLSADRLTLTFNADASSPGDQFRIFTISVPVPEPQVWLLLALSAFVVVLRQR